MNATSATTVWTCIESFPPKKHLQHSPVGHHGISADFINQTIPRWTYLQGGSKSGGWVQVPGDPIEWPNKKRSPTKKQMIKRSKSNSAVLDGSGFVTIAGYRIRWIHSLLLGFGSAAGNCSMPCIRSFERWRPESTPKNDLQNWDTTGRSSGLFQCAVQSTLYLVVLQELICIYFMSYHLWLPVL